MGYMPQKWVISETNGLYTNNFLIQNSIISPPPIPDTSPQRMWMMWTVSPDIALPPLWRIANRCWPWHSTLLWHSRQSCLDFPVVLLFEDVIWCKLIYDVVAIRFKIQKRLVNLMFFGNQYHSPSSCHSRVCFFFGAGQSLATVISR